MSFIISRLKREPGVALHGPMQQQGRKAVPMAAASRNGRGLDMIPGWTRDLSMHQWSGH